jgi:hypothetical protein
VRWKKLGQVFAPDGNRDWMLSHAANPFAEQLDGDLFRVHFTCRDAQSRSHVAYADINLVPPFHVHGLCTEPVLTPGEAGLFDDSGCALGCIVNTNSKRRMYYLGWNLGVTVPWRNTIGVAEWDHRKNRFIKRGRAPLMDRSEEDPFTVSYPWIIDDDGLYKMWYGSNLKWGRDQSDMQHVVKYAESKDGITWQRSPDVAVGLEHPNEYALSKPVVLKEKGLYRMWYSFRANGKITTYRIGYAESQDAKSWQRKDGLAGIDVSLDGWDSEMICYPFIFEHRESRYMLYNGNGYGKTGFGLAVLEQDHL